MITEPGVFFRSGRRRETFQTSHGTEIAVLQPLQLREQGFELAHLSLSGGTLELFFGSENGLQGVNDATKRGPELAEDASELCGPVGALKRRQSIKQIDVERVKGDGHSNNTGRYYHAHDRMTITTPPKV